MGIKVNGLVAGYSRENPILNSLDLEAKAGRVTTIIGPNGAGKSTLLRTIFGYLKPMSGTITHYGANLDGIEPERMLSEGLAYLIQGRSVFPSMSVAENLELGCWTIRHDRPRVKRALASAYEQYPRLAQKQKYPAGSLSGGEQRTLEIARLTMTGPRTLLLDEPSVGLMPSLVEEVYQHIDLLKKDNFTILLVDQNIRKALEVSDYVYVIQLGRNRDHGEAQNFNDRLPELVKEWI